MGPAWWVSLDNRLSELGRWLEGRLVFEPDPSLEVVPAEQYLDPDFLHEAIARARHMHATEDDNSLDPDTDLRIAVSRFTRQYASSVSIVALVSLANGVGVDVSARRCRMIVKNEVPFLMTFVDDDEKPTLCGERPTDWLVEGPVVPTIPDLRQFVWRKLYAEHLSPLYERALEITKVSDKLMWTNAAEWVGMVSDAADEYLEPSAALPYVQDRLALLREPRLPGLSGGNPLNGRLQWDHTDAPDFPHGVQVREMCCITYLLPDRLGRLCQNCGFLPLDERIQLIRERRGVPMGTPGGPAEENAIRRGLEKIRSVEADPVG
jgi:Ferric iron reductase FhuF-like transporter